MDRCPACRAQAYFFGYQARPVGTRWIVCYDCRGITNSNGSKNMYTFMTDTGLVGSTAKEPSKGYFRTGKDIEVTIND